LICCKIIRNRSQLLWEKQKGVGLDAYFVVHYGCAPRSQGHLTSDQRNV